MATLGSPGVLVTVQDESFYTPSGPGTVPLFFVTSRQDKSNASATGTAQGTTTAKQGDVYLITSQRDLADTFGNPIFETNASGNVVQGSEISEYGLQAAYSALGVSSRAYIARADVNLTQLSSSATEPIGLPNNNQYWVDTANTLFGLNEWDATTQKFTVKTVKVLDDVTSVGNVDGDMVPLSSYGNKGEYAIVLTSDNENIIYYKTSANVWAPVYDGHDGGKQLVISPHTLYPNFTSSGINAPTGSNWIKTTTPGFGANWIIKLYSSPTKAWSTKVAPLYTTLQEAIYSFDASGGGKNISVGTLFVETNYTNANINTNEYTANFKIWRRKNSGATSISVIAPTTTNSNQSEFTIRETLAGTSNWSNFATITIPGSPTASIASLMPAAISAAGLTNIVCTYEATTRVLTISHTLGGDFKMFDGAENPLSVLGFDTNGDVSNLYPAPQYDDDGAYTHLASNWAPLSYQAKASAPYTAPANGTLWYSGGNTDVDIMVQNGGTWKGYRTVYPSTDPAGPLIRATEPVDGDRSDGGSLVDGDIWVSTADPERYGLDIYVWNNTSDLWVKQDPTDSYSPTGWVFADARAGTAGSGETSADAPTGTINDLLLSNFLDPDAPNPALYPAGTRLWNTRRSGNNVKKYVVGHIDITANNGLNTRFGNESMANYSADRWVTQNVTNADGSGLFGRHAQRGYVVSSLKSLIDKNLAIRDTDTVDFNLIACPGYPEAIQNMIALNTDRGQTAFIVGDSPFRLEPTGTTLSNWGNNTAGAADNNEQGLVSRSEYLGVFYPSGLTTNFQGKDIVVPPSHMMIRTILNSDARSYQWFAPAGTRRGSVDNATQVGYINSNGEFKGASLYESLRTVLKDVQINPIATLPGAGIVNFGQYTRSATTSALDRINVARLVSYLRKQLAVLAKPYLFEPNDVQTRREIKAAADSLLIELVGQRALYDFITVCDSTNNTPARIDKNELWLDVAIEPVKAVEFIYIPLRIKNTGEIAAGV
jgi:hypothetical protein